MLLLTAEHWLGLLYCVWLHRMLPNEFTVLMQRPYLYVDSGNVGTGEQQIEAGTDIVFAHLLDIGYVNGTGISQNLCVDGAHDEASWGARVHVPLTTRYGKCPGCPPPPLLLYADELTCVHW